MFTVEVYAAIRRAVMIEGLSCREAARRFGAHRNTITKMLQYSAPPGNRRRERPISKKLGPFMGWIDKVLADDRSVEALVGFVRRNFMTPQPVAESFDALNARLLDGCMKRRQTILRGHSTPIGR